MQALSNYITEAKTYINFRNICRLMCALLLASALLAEWLMWSETPVFAHDALCYVSGYGCKLSAEGRWLNYILFPILKLFNGYVVSLVNMGCLFVFSWSVFRRFLPISDSIIAALATLTFPPVHAMNYWPSTMLLSYLTLLGAALLYKNTPKWLVFVSSAILLNGGLPTFYFFLPLLYFGEENRREFIRTLVWWIIAFIIGVAFAEMMTLLKCHHFIQPQEYRHFKLVASFSDLWNNALQSLKCMINALSLVGKQLGLLCVICALISLYRICVKRELQTLYLCILLLLISLSVYAHATIGGVVVAIRSAMCMFFAVFLICIWAMRRTTVLVAVLSLLFASYFISGNSKDIRYWNTLRKAMCDELKAMPYQPYEIDSIIFIATAEEYAPHVEHLAETWGLTNTASQLNYIDSWSPIPRVCGYFCPIYCCDAEETAEKVGSNLSEIPFLCSGIYMHAKVGRYLLIKFS